MRLSMQFIDCKTPPSQHLPSSFTKSLNSAVKMQFAGKAGAQCQAHVLVLGLEASPSCPWHHGSFAIRDQRALYF